MLIARIAHLADAGAPADYVACFSEDALWELTDATGLTLDAQRIEGRDALLEGVLERRAAGVQGPGTHTLHDVSAIDVTVDGDHATARTCFRYYRSADALPELAAIGIYEDRFVRGADGWLLELRVISRG